INFITAITKYQHVDDIAARLMIPKETVLDVLTQLENFGFVKKINQRWIYQSGAAHTEAHSPLVNLFHTGWRNRAMVDMQKISGSGVHYSNVQAVEKKLFEEMKTELSQLIHRFSVLADRSASEELICLNVDLFEV
ncbi:MAG TPA: DUF4423 domain-containing protein, partial [Bdellovibrio sp.]|nr:DUF4423 domain-containing protein [Bdellovibrio sp.]